MSFSELWSHPNRKLTDHLLEVGNIAKKLIKEKKINIPSGEREYLNLTVFIVGICHDFGKSTSYFQKYIREEDEIKKRKLKNKSETKHGLFSAIFTYYIFTLLLQRDKSEHEYLSYFAFLAVKRHHGNLQNFHEELLSLRNVSLAIFHKQAEAVDKQILPFYKSQLLINISIEKFKDNLEDIIAEIKRKGKKFLRSVCDSQSITYYLIFQTLYSCLLNADKISASQLSEPVNYTIPHDLVDKLYKTNGWNLPKKSIDSLRLEIYESVINKIDSLDFSKYKIFSLNVPTGTGKTLTAFSFALKLRKLLFNNGQSSKIIYCLPFLSIIDQNFDVFSNAVKLITEKPTTTNVILKHHHLSSGIFNTENNEFTGTEGRFLIEGWNAEIIVTTFMQLFHTIFSSKNKSLRKFHNIPNSIIILDEIQTLPPKYWLLIRQVFKSLAKTFNCYFLLLTATFPLLFNPSNNEIYELVDKKEKYFLSLDRVKLIYHPDIIELVEFNDNILTMIRENPDKSFLIILNTINAAKDFFTYLVSSLEQKTPIFYLTSHIIPKQRLLILKSMKQEKHTRIIISTQIIEAGVDLDVDIVIRDFGPLDSINQIAGRCNRHNVHSKGQVHIFILKDNYKEYHRYIYSSFLIGKSKEILEKFSLEDGISEQKFFQMNQLYNKKIYQFQSNDESRKVLEYIHCLQFDFLNKHFKLIENDDYEKIDVFIEHNNQAKAIWKNFLAVLLIKDPFKRKDEFTRMKADFYSYIISVPKNKAPPIENNSFIRNKNLGLAYVSSEELHIFYDSETGYKNEGAGEIFF